MKKNVLRSTFLLFLCLFLTLNFYGQTKNSLGKQTEDSYKYLDQLIHKNINDTIKVKNYATRYFLKARKDNDFMKMEFGQYYLGVASNDFDYYYKFCDSLITFCKEKGLIDLELKIRSNKARAYYYFNTMISKSLAEYLKINKALKKHKNDSLQYVTNVYLGLIKEYNKDYLGALKLLKETYFKVQKNKKLTGNEDDFLNLPMSIVSNYVRMGAYDSAYVYLNRAEEQYRSIGDTMFLGALNFSRAKLQFKQAKYKETITSLFKFIPSAKKDNNSRLLQGSYSMLGISYDNLGRKKESFLYHKKVDSIYRKHKIITSNMGVSYNFLINESKKERNQELQLAYINTLLEIKSAKVEKDIEINKSLYEEYDKPKLIEEKNAIINQLEKKALKDKLLKFFYLFLIALVLSILGYQIKKKIDYKKQFSLIIHNQPKEKIEIQNSSHKLTPKKTSSLQQDVVKDLLAKLSTFEKERGFLKEEINLNKLANEFETNSNYLSKVINQEKKLSFINYIDKLRIDYIVKELQKNKKLQRYTVKALAKEAGFKSTESFSKAFHKFTNIRPSYFIKELSKMRKK